MTKTGIASIRYHRIFFALIGLIPLLGIVNWIAIPLLVPGLIVGIIGICGKKKEVARLFWKFEIPGFRSR